MTFMTSARCLLGGQALVRFGLEAEGCVQVLAHDHVLDLRRFDQQAPQLLAVLDYELHFCHHSSRPGRDGNDIQIQPTGRPPDRCHAGTSHMMPPTPAAAIGAGRT
jgi:hypothetical protein